MTNQIINYLDTLFPNAECELKFDNNFQLLVAVILSAQCTDKRVNQVTDILFKKVKSPEDVVNLGIEKLKQIIFPCGFYNNKAKNIFDMSNDLITRFNKQVPSTKEELMSLKGVGQKTANVVLSMAFNGDAIAVDTHVFRVSKRLGLSSQNNPLKVEEDLCKIFDRKLWSKLHYQMVLFGRYYCKARNPNCKDCKLKEICKYTKQ